MDKLPNSKLIVQPKASVKQTSETACDSTILVVLARFLLQNAKDFCLKKHLQMLDWHNLLKDTVWWILHFSKPFQHMVLCSLRN